ncbi:MAG: ribosomal protein S18-alanine N-acetyltransferase [Aquihabitans sp.]
MSGSVHDEGDAGAGSTLTDAIARSADGPRITITPMRRRHLDAVLAIEGRAQARPWSLRLFEDELERGGRHYVVARTGPTVIGFAGLLMIADDGHVATVAVEPAQQGSKIATRLIVELVQAALSLGANQLTLEVRVSNTRAQSLYRRFGFVPAGVRKGYYADNGEDAIVMWAHDVDQPSYAERLADIEASLPSPTVRVGFEAAESGSQTASVHPAAGGGRMEP